ncbi:hypothetical protein KCP75_00210 [Salmonella enterica subsp. enterica]|nr:hypothetical protein KCP75_00210 [Salmonella enterica subsp. enterica]
MRRITLLFRKRRALRHFQDSDTFADIGGDNWLGAARAKSCVASNGDRWRLQQKASHSRAGDVFYRCRFIASVRDCGMTGYSAPV